MRCEVSRSAGIFARRAFERERERAQNAVI
jgi:hypothetical protein